MEPQNPLMTRATVAAPALARNRVLRHTYMLLAISMVPTVLGAWLGLRLNFSLVGGAHPAVGAILFLAIAFGFMFAIEKTKNSAAGIAVLLAFTFFMGLVLSRLLGVVLGLANGASLIALAFGGTGVIFASMATIGTVVKRDLSGLARFLFIGAVLLVIAGFANIFLQIPALMVAYSVIAIAIFSAFMVVDVNRIVSGGETNYITATLMLYLDLYNVFVNLLALLGIAGGRND
ncbi:MAG TPA: Bax inhibitor-1 family protein [Usitatibacter sp.]|nr:Bax inhibitor-1 family protein [Usitatibacter sp.]